MPARLLHSHLLTGVLGLATVAVGSITQEQAATLVGVAALVWSGLLAGYDKWRASRRTNDRLDHEAKLAELKAERAILEAAVVSLKSELSGLQVARNQHFVEEGR